MVELDGEVSPSVDGSLDSAGTPTIAIVGDLDMASVAVVGEKIEPFLKDGPERVVFDLSRLTFMDSSGITLLLKVANRVGTVEVRDPTPIVRRVIEVTGLGTVFGIDQ
jgi:anti-sigma B factor antagonist